MGRSLSGAVAVVFVILCRAFQDPHELRRDVLKGKGRRTMAGHALICMDAHSRIQRYLSQIRSFGFFTHAQDPARTWTEHIGAHDARQKAGIHLGEGMLEFAGAIFPRVWIHDTTSFPRHLESRHVLHHSQHPQPHLFAKVQFLAHVVDRHVLRGGHDNCSVHTIGGMEQLGERDVLVRGPWWGVDDKVVEFGPIHVLEELFDEAVFPGSPPDDGFVFVVEQESDGHDTEVVVHIHRGPSEVALMHFLSFQSQHGGYRRSTDVHVQQPHFFILGCERVGQLCGERAFSHPSFSREHEHDVSYIFQPCRHLLRVRFGLFLRRSVCTCASVGTSLTRVFFSRTFRSHARTRFGHVLVVRHVVDGLRRKGRIASNS
mmetsp:Transcript_8480/g.52987  ORF Transcript_8480/g.52987 Transcript_8480/m.52987 type:complete len:373 (-) Transcript_8480:54-1172(-)